MERYLVGFLTAALLFANAGHSRAGHVYVHQSSGLGTGGEQFLNLLGIAGAPFECDFVADALNYRGKVLLISSLVGFSSSDSRVLEPAGTASSESDVAFLADSACFGTESARFNDLIGAEPAWAKDFYSADTIIQRSELLSGDDPFRSFTNGMAPAEPARISIDPAGTGSVNALNLWGLSSIGIVALATLAYTLRRRRTMPNRGLRGPRGTAIYRSPSPTNPRGTVR